VIHYTGKVPGVTKMIELTRSEWDEMTEKFIVRPAIAAQKALGAFVPGGGEDPRLFKGTSGCMMIVGPELPSGRKTTGIQRAHAEVFRGALRPFATTVNQELSDVLHSDIRVFAALPGSVTGAEPDPQRVADLFDFVMQRPVTGGGGGDSSGEPGDGRAPAPPASSLSTVIFCTDEAR